jgi:catechol 2,3-dioxygenase-like lactoylglutathione lyase family enzyme
VESIQRSTAFYVERLGFDLRLALPEEDPFFAIVGRDAAQLLFKSVAPDVMAQPNPTRHHDALWDAFVYTANPDALFAEFTERAVPFHEALGDRDDGLRGFELQDPDGYVLYFGRPQGS